MIDTPHAASDSSAAAEPVPVTRATTFYWFQGASVQQLSAALMAADPSTARLEVHQVGEKMWLHVIPATTARAVSETSGALPAIDDSFVCPPICPG